METHYRTFKEFYPFYLQEHSNSTCRRLHFAGSTIVLLLVAMAIVTGELALLWLLPVVGYGFAWVGHFFFEHNRPATFKYPLFSLMGDWVMFRDMLTGRVAW
ncbi:Mpo1-like protein [Duganella sp. Root1480D1]|uniref:Mpo1-like protein n=1 Tax=Duganella sp. Root1480D1 TaxID=1736471 RepID=UPI000A5AE6B8